MRLRIHTLPVERALTGVAPMLSALLVVITVAMPPAQTSAVAGAGPRARSPMPGAVSAHGVAGGGAAGSRMGGGGSATAGTPNSNNPLTVADREFLDPAKYATPERTNFTSIVPSPGFGLDHVVFAAGNTTCQRRACGVLFRSDDAGATWRPMASQFFGGGKILLPPDYPRDARIFAIGSQGLQESDDGGATFRVDTPLTGSAAISPAFDNNDPRILIGAGLVHEYLVDKRIARPSMILSQPGVRQTIAFSPQFANGDPTILIGDVEPAQDGRGWQSIVSTCVDTSCTKQLLPGGNAVPDIRLSPDFARDRRAFAFDGTSVFTSTGPAVSWTRLPFDVAPRVISDVRVGNGGALYVAIGGAGPSALYRSNDGGATWSTLRIRRSDFSSGAGQFAQLPNGAIMASSFNLGMACSTDSGRTWNNTCNY